jgi:hypothetical protein
VTAEEIVAWQDVEGDRWKTLLIGNGLSVNIWEWFGYGKLKDKAELSVNAEAVFKELATPNFEAVLEAIHHARSVSSILGEPTDAIDALYAEVRDVLFATVSKAHIEWVDIPHSTFMTIAETVASYRSVFTTNYDLILYWSHMAADSARSKMQPPEPRLPVKDFLWKECESERVFDAEHAHEWWQERTGVYYLHGGLHLWQDDSGVDGKWTRASGGSLSRVQENYAPGAARQPLFVSEGNPSEKKRRIGSSTYLQFCLESLAADEQDTVVFGHSLSGQDKHIADALNEGAPKEIAVSVYPGGPAGAVDEFIGRIKQALGKRHGLCFFDSTTFPLGRPELRVAEVDFEALAAWLGD